MEQEERVRSLREVLTSGLSGGEGSPSAFLGSYAGDPKDSDYRNESILAKLGEVGKTVWESSVPGQAYNWSKANDSPRALLDSLIRAVEKNVDLDGPVPELSPEEKNRLYAMAEGAGFAGGMLKMHGIGKSLVLASKYGGPDKMSLFKEGLLVPQKDWTNVKNVTVIGKGASWYGPRSEPSNTLAIGTLKGRKGVLAHEFTHERFDFPADAMEKAVIDRLGPVSEDLLGAHWAGKLKGGFDPLDYWHLSPEEQTAMALARKALFAIEKNQPFNFDRAFMESTREGQGKALNFMERYVAGDLGGKMPEPNLGIVSQALADLKKLLGIKDRNVSYSVGKGETPRSMEPKVPYGTAPGEARIDLPEGITKFNKGTVSSAEASLLDTSFAGSPVPAYFFNRLISKERGKGGGTKVLREMLDEMDKLNTPLVNQVSPYGDMSMEQMVNFYKKEGFTRLGEEFGDELLIYHPGSRKK